MVALRPFKFIKQFFPKSLFGRFLLILLVPLLLVQIVLGYIFFDRHTATILRTLSQTIAGDIALVTHVAEQGKSFSSLKSIAQKHLRFTMTYKRGEKLNEIGQAKDTWLYDHMGDALDEQLSHPYYLRMNRETIFIDVQLKRGVLHIELPRKRLFSKTTPLVLIWTTASALLLFIVAMLFMRNQIKPIRRLADAAERFGKGQELIDFKAEGALEVRKAAVAFNLMRQRILRFIEDRTHQLAGISHDLRTPLARMKLQLALLPQNEGTQYLRNDVDEMIGMIQGFLDYSRGILNEPTTEVNLQEYLSQFLEDWRRGNKLEVSLSIEGDGNPSFHFKKQLFNRMLTNLLLNAQKHAQEALLTVQLRPSNILIFVDDNGPGIEEDKRDLVFQPFQRLDPARGLETGGVGLGLTIVRDVVHSHGGRIQLDHAPIGGLRVKIWLPR